MLALIEVCLNAVHRDDPLAAECLWTILSDALDLVDETGDERYWKAACKRVLDRAFALTEHHG